MTVVPRFTPGRFTALWVVVRSLRKLGGTASAEDLLAFARRNGLRSGGLPIKDGYQLAILGGFVSGGDHLTITKLGQEVLSRGDEEEPSPEVLRLLISVLFLRHPPAWVAYWQGDPSSIDIVIPEGAHDLLQDARLLQVEGFEDLAAWALWDALKEVPPNEVTAEQRKAIGDAAEALSFQYEQERLRSEGFPELATRVRWVARESAAYGFDILSFCGNLRSSLQSDRPLAIEVKGQAIAARGNFSFYITNHEWKTAGVLQDQYVFHLWDGIRPGTTETASRTTPVLILPAALEIHIPRDPQCGSACHWKSAWISLSLPL